MQEITEFKNISKEAQDAIQDINWEELMSPMGQTLLVCP